MKPTILKHCAGRNYNSPLKQINSKTKLKNVPEELSNSIERGVDRVGNKIKRGIDRIGNMSIGEAASKAVGVLASPAGPRFSGIVEKNVREYLNGPSIPAKKNPGKLRKDSKSI